MFKQMVCRVVHLNYGLGVFADVEYKLIGQHNSIATSYLKRMVNVCECCSTLFYLSIDLRMVM